MGFRSSWRKTADYMAGARCGFCPAGARLIGAGCRALSPAPRSAASAARERSLGATEFLTAAGSSARRTAWLAACCGTAPRPALLRDAIRL